MFYFNLCSLVREKNSLFDPYEWEWKPHSPPFIPMSSVDWLKFWHPAPRATLTLRKDLLNGPNRALVQVF
jgi:hypothetical protein